MKPYLKKYLDRIYRPWPNLVDLVNFTELHNFAAKFINQKAKYALNRILFFNSLNSVKTRENSLLNIAAN